MKKFTKLLGIVLIIALVMSMGITAAFAADNDRSITVDVNYKGQQYTLYKIFNATTNAQRQAEIDENSDTSVNMPGIAYTLIDETDHALDKIFEVTLSDGTTKKPVKGSDWFEFLNENSKNIKVKDNVDITTEEFRLWAKAYGVQQDVSLTAAKDNDPEIKWTGLTDGYYFINTTTGSLVTVDSIAPNAIVKDKNSPPTIEKKVQEDSIVAKTTGATDGDGVNAYQKQNDVEVGQTVYFRTVIHAKPGSQKYVLYDKMDEQLTFAVNTDHPITVYVVDPLTGDDKTAYASLGTAVETFTAASEGTSATLDISGKYKHDGTDNASFILTFKDTWLKDTLKTINDKNETVPAAKDIVITYSAVLNNKAVINTAYKNDTILKYGDNNTYTAEEETWTFTWGIDALKFGLDKMADTDYKAADEFESVEQANASGYVYNPAHTNNDGRYWVKDTAKKALKDAEFVIYRTETEGDTTKVFYAIFEDVTQVINEETKTIKKFKEWTAADTTAETELVKKETSYFSDKGATVLTTPENGTFAVQGLDEGTYYLLETKAPAGYNKLTEAIKVVLDSTSDKADIAKELTTALTVADSKEGSVHKDVFNNTGAVLPSTGGIGTTIFYVVGSILVVAAGVLLITKKRMGREG